MWRKRSKLESKRASLLVEQDWVSGKTEGEGEEEQGRSRGGSDEIEGEEWEAALGETFTQRPFLEGRQFIVQCRSPFWQEQERQRPLALQRQQTGMAGKRDHKPATNLIGRARFLALPYKHEIYRNFSRPSSLPKEGEGPGG